MYFYSSIVLSTKWSLQIRRIMVPTDDKTSKEVEIGIARPLDGRYGWVIVFAAFMMNFIVFGILNSFGILFVELSEELQTGKAATAWISSITFGTLMVSSPVSSVLSTRHGNRMISIIGSLIAGIGFISSGFTENIYFLYVSLGLVSGIGFGLVYLPFVVSVGIYFEKKKSFAMGISVCGTGVGTFIFAPIVEGLLNEYGWKGSTLILGGIVLNLAVFASLLRPHVNHFDNDKYICINTEETSDPDLYSVPQNVAYDISSNNFSEVSKTCDFDLLTVKTYDAKLFEETEKFLANKQIVLSAICKSNLCPKEEGDFKNVPKEHTFTRILKSALSYYDFSLFKNFIFIIFLFSNFIIMLGLNAPYIYLPDRSQEKGVSKSDSALFISVIGIANMAGRIVIGWLADRKWVNRLLLYSTSMVVCGLATIINPFNDSVEYLMVYSALFGCFSGVFVCLYAIILIDLLGLEKFSNALGIVIMVQGIASFIGPPAAGWLYSKTGNYNTSFYAIGAVLIFGGLLVSLIPVARKYFIKQTLMLDTECEVIEKTYC
ncbi:monocarboxylate transporter 12-like isoform X1 [Mytilus californianus]|uniref:monocarboxylate transporter 12-like isoform X1 n=2 Tax=Mytilus californianus TaxID=6549 RepID=UPI0022450387|nr:monocarboxylate transporter 12-like isoform X1 [Mytilus californianus]